MPIRHKFENKPQVARAINWPEVFATENAIKAAFPNRQAGAIYTATGMRLANIPGYPSKPFSLAWG